MVVLRAKPQLVQGRSRENLTKLPVSTAPEKQASICSRSKLAARTRVRTVASPSRSECHGGTGAKGGPPIAEIARLCEDSPTAILGATPAMATLAIAQPA
jgi:hypothetical protein